MTFDSGDYIPKAKCKPSPNIFASGLQGFLNLQWQTRRGLGNEFVAKPKRLEKIKRYAEIPGLVPSIPAPLAAFFADYPKPQNPSACNAFFETIKVHQTYIYIAALIVIAYRVLYEFRKLVSEHDQKIEDLNSQYARANSALKSKISGQSKNLKTLSQNSHEISHKLRDTIARLRDLSAKWHEKIDSTKI